MPSDKKIEKLVEKLREYEFDAIMDDRNAIIDLVANHVDLLYSNMDEDEILERAEMFGLLDE